MVSVEFEFGFGVRVLGMTDRYLFRCEGLGLAITDGHLDVGLVVHGYDVVRKELGEERGGGEGKGRDGGGDKEG